MKNTQVSILVFIYNSYRDPLFQNLLLSYIKTLSAKGNYRFDLVTFEQTQYQLTPEQAKKEKEMLESFQIYWHPMTFHTGKFLLLKKLVDFAITAFTIIKIKLLHRSAFIFAFANVAASFCILFKRILRLRMVIYSYEPHSDFLVELGLWNSSDFQYKILSKLERLAGKEADIVMTGTKYGVELLEDIGSKAKLYRAPTAVDPNEFVFKPEGRSRIRKQYQIENKDVFIYMGKFGGLYYEKETIEVCNQIYQQNPNAHFLIVTTYDHSQIKAWSDELGLDESAYTLTGNLSDSEVKEYLSASDFGISAVPPSPAQKYRSPTKVAEYLLCGLPYITCAGVSEDDSFAVAHEVGVVFDQFSKEEVDKNYHSMESILGQNRESVRTRCREVAIKYRSKERIDNILAEVFRHDT